MIQTETIYLTEVTRLGPEVPDFLEAGLLITFAEGAPPELAEMSVLHKPTTSREAPPQPGDVLSIGEHAFRITAVGEKAWKNVLELGHAVFKFNGEPQTELPGEIYVEEPGDVKLLEEIRPGARVEIKSAERSD
ncbi:MAG: PTS glucitol/sorbitol transporter subunit IIA [Rubrobacter sp.]|jgi:PTS system glucitol/sorbitol-specific IIA component|nr:PTS glucitol/sorbitol transporter subunit IIA [Rubrobacter sp.]